MKNTIKVLSVLIVIIMLIMAVLPSVNAAGVVLSEDKTPITPDIVGDGTKKYEKDFLNITEMNSPYSEHGPSYFYVPLYEYYEDEPDENAIADYVLVFSGKMGFGPAYSFGFYGNYVVVSNGCYNPYELGYWIYLPNEGRVLKLRQAYDLGVKGIEELFADYGLGTLMGDMDKDEKLTVKDATYIQKCIAGIYSFPSDDQFRALSEVGDGFYFHFSDFNRDGVRNIKDATAIQKYIAGLEY